VRVAAVFGLYLVLAAVLILHQRGRVVPDGFIDELTYGRVAQNLAAGDGFTYQGLSPGYRSLLPYAIAPAWALFSGSTAYHAALVVNAALMNLVVFPAYAIARRVAPFGWFLDDGHHEERFKSWDEPVDKLMERAGNREIVRKEIDALPEGYRTVLVLRDIEGLDTEETAKVLGLSVNATKIRLHRARQALRTLLAPHFRSAVS